MRLHNDRDAFGVLLDSVSERTGIRMDILEKDYYVTLLLSELAEKQAKLPAYFKGGTALYKSIGKMKRFSEDIDLTVESKTAQKVRAKNVLKTLQTHTHVWRELKIKKKKATQKAV